MSIRFHVIIPFRRSCHSCTGHSDPNCEWIFIKFGEALLYTHIYHKIIKHHTYNAFCNFNTPLNPYSCHSCLYIFMSLYPTVPLVVRYINDSFLFGPQACRSFAFRLSTYRPWYLWNGKLT